jgi:NTE family protein
MKRLALAALGLLAACATYNKPLTAVAPDAGYRFGKMETPARQDDTFVMLTFSGGGTRAAALSYGVLQALDDTPIRGGTKDMLDLVDVVSSVSGGSFTAAHYALFGRAGFATFRKDFLDQPATQRRLALSTLYPTNAFRLLSPRYNRIDHAANFIDRMLFHGATFSAIPKTAPYTILNATEMDLGSRFEFTQEQFDTICSDLGSVRIASGVAASSAFPVLLTPITFRSYADAGCGYQPPQWFALAANDRETNPERYRYRGYLAALLNPQRRFLHLIDGGVADNIGVRGPLHAMVSNDTLQMNDGNPVNGFSVMRMMVNDEIKRVVVIVVNAKTENDLSRGRSGATPLIPSVLSVASNAPMGNYSSDSVTLMREAMRERGFGDVKLDFIEVAFSVLPAGEQAHFNAMGTNYSLSKAQVAELIAVAKRILNDSGTYKQLVHDLQ